MKFFITVFFIVIFSINANSQYQQLQKDCLTTILNATASTEKQIVIEAIKMLKNLKDKSTISLLEKLLNKEISDETRMEIAFTLYGLGQKSYANIIVQQLNKKNTLAPDARPIEKARFFKQQTLRINAIKLLGELKDGSYISVLRKIINNKDEEGRVKDEALISIAKLGDRTECCEIFLDGLNSSDSRVRIKACEVLGELKESSATGKLIQFLTHWDKDVRANSSISLAKINDKKYGPKIVELLFDKEAFVRASASESLGILKDTTFIPQLKKVINEDKEGFVKLTASIALMKLENDSGEYILFQAINADKDLDVKLKSIQTFAEYGKEKHIKELEKNFQKEQNLLIKLNLAYSIIKIIERKEKS